MIDRIVIALDGSELSREAFEYAAALSKATGWPLEVLHVREKLPIHALPAGAPDDGFMSIAEAIESCRHFAEFSRVEFDVTMEQGDLTDHLDRAADRRTLLVVGLKGRFSRVGVGSATRWLVQHARGPLMILTGPSQRELNRVLAVHDGAPPSLAAVQFGRMLARRTGWPLTVLVLPVAAPLTRIDAELEAVAPGAQVLVEEATGRSEAEHIEVLARRARHALLVLGAYPDSWARQLFRGGTTGHVLRHLAAPVVLVR